MKEVKVDVLKLSDWKLKKENISEEDKQYYMHNMSIPVDTVCKLSAITENELREAVKTRPDMDIVDDVLYTTPSFLM